MLHTGHVITYAVCPVLWCSKLQTGIAFNYNKAEYIALIQAMCEVIPFMELMKEVYFIFDVHLPKPELSCKVSKDNQICISVAESKTLPPRTKHISIKYNHFLNFIQKNIIQIYYIDTREKTADIFTKPLDEA